jgi:hypothetical protein
MRLKAWSIHDAIELQRSCWAGRMMSAPSRSIRTAKRHLRFSASAWFACDIRRIQLLLSEEGWTHEGPREKR